MKATVNTTFESTVKGENPNFEFLLTSAINMRSNQLKAAAYTLLWKTALRDCYFNLYGEKLLELSSLTEPKLKGVFYQSSNEDFLEYLKEKALNYEREEAKIVAQALKIWAPTLTQKIKNYGYK
jgi:hypothetical protein